MGEGQPFSVLVLLVVVLTISLAARAESISPERQVHPYGVFFGTFAHPASVWRRLQGVTECDAGDPDANHTVYVLGRDISGLVDSREETTGCDGPNTKESRDERARLLRNPLTGEPFPDGTIYFAPAKKNVLAEIGRVVTVTVFGFESYKRAGQLKSSHIGTLFCHSNGCTEAARLVKKGYLSVDFLINLGSPWGSTPFVPRAVSSQFSNPLDVVLLVEMVRLPSAFWSGMQKASFENGNPELGPQEAFPPLVQFQEEDVKGDRLEGHALTKYFAALEAWTSKASATLDPEWQEPRPEYVLPGTASLGRLLRGEKTVPYNIRQAMPWIARGWQVYREFNIQSGYESCEAGRPQRDCAGRYYVNYRFDNHKFDGPGVSLEAAKACVDALRDLTEPGYGYDREKDAKYRWKLLQSCLAKASAGG